MCLARRSRRSIDVVVRYGAGQVPVRARHALGGVPPRRHAVDAVRHAHGNQSARRSPRRSTPSLRRSRSSPPARRRSFGVDLSTERLATLASEGRSWVLSIGDVLLNATEPLALKRSRDQDGRFQMAALLGRPYKVHSFRDPDRRRHARGRHRVPAGSWCRARSELCRFRRAAFGAWPRDPARQRAAERCDRQGRSADHSAGRPDLSDQDAPRALDSGNASEFRDSFIDLAVLREDDPAAFVIKREKLSEAGLRQGRAGARGRPAEPGAVLRRQPVRRGGARRPQGARRPISRATSCARRSSSPKPSPTCSLRGRSRRSTFSTARPSPTKSTP